MNRARANSSSTPTAATPWQCTGGQPGPVPAHACCDWLVARLRGKPFGSERWLVEATGRIVKTPI